MRGLPASGKSTFLNKANLNPYTLSADDIRLMYGAIDYKVDETNGTRTCINGKYDKRVWEFLMERLEERMARGETVFVDATHYSHQAMTAYYKLREKYKYKVYVLDFTDVPLETCLAENENRVEFKRVPEKVIRNMHEIMTHTKVPSKYTVVNTKTIYEETLWKRKNLDEYKAVHVIGDVHSCYTVLNEALGEIKDDHFYVFLGDYFDRGIEHEKTFDFFRSLIGKPNVVLLEGNHEAHLRNLVWDKEIKNADTKKTTIPALLKHLGGDKKPIKKLVNSLMPMFYFEFAGKTYLCSHGGITGGMFWKDVESDGVGTLNNILIPESIYIKGVGGYQFDVDKEWDMWKELEVTQIHGHRNIFGHSEMEFEKSFNLEQAVEAGGRLGVIEITPDNVEVKSVKNNVFDAGQSERKLDIDISTLSKHDVRKVLDKSPYVQSKEFQDYHVYNFTSSAFFGKNWTKFSITARGLFLDKDDNVAMRGYKKFFNVNENEETTIPEILKKVKFPVTATLKEDGFLGLCSYDKTLDKIIYSSKGGSKKHGNIFRENLYSSTTTDFPEKVQEVIKKYPDITFLFEVMSDKDMPHIVDYSVENAMFLDAINNDYTNTFNFQAANEMKALMKHRSDSIVFENADDLADFIHRSSHTEKDIEGYVLRDTNNYMFKLKTDWFKTWKEVRGKLAFYAKGKIAFNEENINNGRYYESDSKKILYALWKNDFPIKTEQGVINVKEAREFYKLVLNYERLKEQFALEGVKI